MMVFRKPSHSRFAQWTYKTDEDNRSYPRITSSVYVVHMPTGAETEYMWLPAWMWVP